MFVFAKAQKDKADAKEADTYVTVARSAAAMFVFFALVRAT